MLNPPPRAIPLLAAGGVGFLVTNMQLRYGVFSIIKMRIIWHLKPFSNLFPKYRAFVISFHNGLYGSSSVVFLAFKVYIQIITLIINIMLVVASRWAVPQPHIYGEFNYYYHYVWIAPYEICRTTKMFVVKRHIFFFSTTALRLCSVCCGQYCSCHEAQSRSLSVRPTPSRYTNHSLSTLDDGYIHTTEH